MFRFLAFWVCITALFSCSSSKEKTSGNDYEADRILRYSEALPSKMQLSMLCDSVESIPLDTAGGFLLGRIEYARFVHNHFFILDENKKLYVFDRNGHGSFFLDRKGQGPQEYIDILGFDVTRDSLLCLLTYPPKLMYYDRKGSFLKEIKLANRGFEFSLLSDDFAVLYKDNVNSTPEQASSMLDVLYLSEGKISSHVDGYRFLAHRSIPSYQQRRTFTDLGDDECLFVHPLSNKVYTVDKTGVRVKYMLDFGDDNPPADLSEKPSSDLLLSDLIADRFSVYGFNGCWENSRYFYIQFMKGREIPKSHGLLYDKVADKFYSGNSLNDDFTDCNPSFFTATEEALIGYWKVDHIIFLNDFFDMRGIEKKPYFKSLYQQAESMENPIMCLYYFKK